MRARIARLSSRIVAALPFVALVFPAAFVAVALSRFTFPFELEWLEGSSIEAARRLDAGLPLYVRPSMEYVPPFYVPLFHYLAWPFTKVLGVFAGPRLLSILCTLGSFVVLAVHVRRETGDARAGWIAASLFAASYGVLEGWFDLARVDSLFVFLSLAAFHAIRFGGAVVGPVGGAALIVLACLAKQSGVLWFLPVVPCVFLMDRRRGLPLGGLVVVLLGGATFLLDAIHDGWYIYYTRKLVSNLDLDPMRLVTFLLADVGLVLPFGVPIAILALRQRDGTARGSSRLYAAFLTGGLIAAVLGRIHPGGDVNSLMPMHASVALLCGVAWGRTTTEPEGSAATSSFRFIPLLVLAQFVLLVRNPLAFVPGERDLEANRALQRRIASIEGDVFVPFHPCLASPRPGMHAHAIALFDVVRRDREGEGPRMAEELRAAFRERRFAAVVVGGSERLFERDLERDYYRAEKLFEAWPDVHPRSGFPIRPAYLYLPRGESDATSGTLAGTLPGGPVQSASTSPGVNEP